MSKLTARGLAYVVRAVGRKIAKAHRAKQTPHGKQTVKKLMAHSASTNSLELSGDTKLFDRVARKWNVEKTAGLTAREESTYSSQMPALQKPFTSAKRLLETPCENWKRLD